MPSTYATKRAYLLKRKSTLPKKEELIPENNIPVVINSKLTVFIHDESKRAETVAKYINHAISGI